MLSVAHFLMILTLRQYCNYFNFYILIACIKVLSGTRRCFLRLLINHSLNLSLAELDCGKPLLFHNTLARSDGTEAVRGSWPWQVYIKGQSGCGGVLIDASHIITIAHCVTTA